MTQRVLEKPCPDNICVAFLVPKSGLDHTGPVSQGNGNYLEGAIVFFAIGFTWGKLKKSLN